MQRNRIKKSIWVPLCLGVYAICMSLYFGPRLVSEGQSVKLWISIAVEVLVVVALFFALRRKERLASEWKD